MFVLKPKLSRSENVAEALCKCCVCQGFIFKGEQYYTHMLNLGGSNSLDLRVCEYCEKLLKECNNDNHVDVLSLLEFTRYTEKTQCSKCSKNPESCGYRVLDCPNIKRVGV